MKKIITAISQIITVFLIGFSFSGVVSADATLAVTGITSEKVTAIADGTYANGWRWVFHVTLPEKENLVQMKFADFSNGASSIPVANNLRLYSVQSTTSPDGASGITITAPNVYSSNLTIATSTDLNPALSGVQVDITVEMKVPVGTVGTGYTTSYGINSSGLVNVSDDPFVEPEGGGGSEGNPEVNNETNIVSGLCLQINPNNWINGGGYISSGVIHKYGEDHNFPGVNMSQISQSHLASGLEWLVYVNASTTNSYSSTVSPEWRAPELISNLTLVGKVTYNNLGEIVKMVSENPNCETVVVIPVEEIQSGMCLVPVDTTHFKVTEGVVLFDGVPRNFPEKPLEIWNSTLNQYGFDWTTYTNYSSSTDHFNVHFTTGLQNFIWGPNPKEVNVGHVKYRDDGTLLSLDSKNPTCLSYYSPEGGGVPVPLVDVVNTKPVVTLTDPAEITIRAGDGYADFHFTALDNEDGDLLDGLNLDHIIWSGYVDIWIPGDYTRTVVVKDSGGLTSDPVSQLVHVRALTPYEQAWKNLQSIWAGHTDYVTNKIVIGSDPGQFDQVDVDVFVAALNSARALLDNPASTTDDLNFGFATLSGAFNTFYMSINP